MCKVECLFLFHTAIHLKHPEQRGMGGQVEIGNKFEFLMFKSSRHPKGPFFEMVFAVKTFWLFEFWSFGIVSNFVLRYSNL